MDHLEKKHPDQERASSRRKQVLDAAETCFGNKGFHAASMAEISKAAGMSAGHIYNYFDSKDEIISAFVLENVQRINDTLGEMEQRADPLQAIFDDLEKNVHADLHPGIWKLPLEMYAEASRNPKVAAVIQESDCRARRRLREILITGRQARGLSIDIPMIDGRVEAIISMFQGLPARALHHPTLDEVALTTAFRLALAALLLSD